MVFSSLVFLCVFLPAVILLEKAMPSVRGKNAVLLAASLVFYAYGEPVYILLLLFSTLFNYVFARLVDAAEGGRRKLLTAGAAAVNLGILVVCKYAGFLVGILNDIPGVALPVPQIVMPLGISFFTFQAMSYVLDVFRKKTDAEKNYARVLLYIVLFPQLIAGPIVKYHDIAEQLRFRTETAEKTAAGIRRFTAGLAKKVLIANTMGACADALFAVSNAEITMAAAWLGSVSYVLQIYFDFSGYSDMAIGMGKIFGFDFLENFNYPYISVSIREFWKRWHISLTTWFREYLYYPLGGNRKGKARTIINRLIVFFLTGLWHGAAWNFIVWGLYNGFLMLLEEALPFFKKQQSWLSRLIGHVYVLLAVTIGFMIFRAEDMTQAGAWLSAMFTKPTLHPAQWNVVLQQLTPVCLVTFAAACIAACPVVRKIRTSGRAEICLDVVSLVGFALCILSLAGGTYNPFIYFRF